MKKTKQYIISFFIPVIIFMLVFFNANIFFEGTKNFLITDARIQYIALFGYLKDVLSGSESLLYSFSKGIGGNMLGTFAYYLASPLNFLIYFFPKHSLDNAILLILILKVGFAGLTMFSYLKNKYNKGKT
ncbi:MAG: YfhO family protein, partial [Mollicutes bacterium]|nr:YfhO family protein [Mollicutes bacterium]